MLQLQNMKSANYTIDLKLKDLLNTASRDFAWEVLQLEISLESHAKPPLEGLMRLIQLYMLGVEVLQNKDDERYNYFNNKIHTIMMRKSVVEQLHRIATGSAPDPETMDKVQKMELENRKSEYQLQISLQKDQYTIISIKEILKRIEHNDYRQNQHIKDHLEGQNQVLEQRIKGRKLRSISKGKINDVELSPKVYSKSNYGVMAISEKDLHSQKYVKLERSKPNDSTGSIG